MGEGELDPSFRTAPGTEAQGSPDELWGSGKWIFLPNSKDLNW